MCTGRHQLASLVATRVGRGRGGDRVLVRVLDRVIRFEGKRDKDRILRVRGLARVLLRELTRGARGCRLSKSAETVVTLTSSLRSVKGVNISRGVLGGPKGLAGRRFRVVGARAIVNTRVLRRLNVCRSRPLMGVTRRVYH